MSRLLLFLFTCSVVCFSCNPTDDEQLVSDPEMEDARIVDHLTDIGLFDQAERLETGVYIVREVEGTGNMPSANSTVEVRYVGSFTNGSVFDQTNGTQTTNFNLQAVVPGFADGIMAMRSGGEATIYIPPSLGYGVNSSNANIPDDTILIFDVDLVSIF